MASAELLKMTHGVDGKVQDVRSDVHDVGNKVEERIEDVRGDVQEVDHRVQTIGSNLSSRVKDVDDKLEQVNSSLSLNPCPSLQALIPLRREPAQR